MDRIDIAVKSGVGIIIGFISIFTDIFGIVFTALLGLMLIDFITGIMAGAKNEGLKSSTGIQGIKKKAYIILLISAVYFMEISVLGSKGIVTNGISGAFIITELISIVENGGRLNVSMPQKLKDLIATIKNDKKDVNSTKSPE